MNFRPLLVALTLSAAHGFAAAPPAPAVEPAFVTTPLHGGVYLLVGRGGNVAVFPNADGTLMIDDQYAPRSKLLQDAVAQITPQPVRLIINTHFHFDHTGGNENFGAAGAKFIAQEKARQRMETGERIEVFKVDQAPIKPVGLPDTTFRTAVTLYRGDETIEVVHPGFGAHTDGDAIVFFHKANVVHMGDIFVTHGGWPFLDTVHGGSVEGTARACEWVLTRINDDTQVIPGHGPLGKKSDVVAYAAKLRTAHDAIAKLKAAGKSVDEIVAADPLKGIDFKEGSATKEIFIRLALEGMERDRKVVP
jgi:cyclase